MNNNHVRAEQRYGWPGVKRGHRTKSTFILLFSASSVCLRIHELVRMEAEISIILQTRGFGILHVSLPL